MIYLTLITLIILLILLCIYVTYQYNYNWEGFSDYSGKYWSSCDNKSFGQCIQCYNCGFSVDPSNGYSGKCVNGSVFGPNKKINGVWYQNNNFWRYNNTIGDVNCISKSYQ